MWLQRIKLTWITWEHGIYKEHTIFLDYEMPPGADSIREISAVPLFPLLSAPEAHFVYKAYLLIQTPMINYGINITRGKNLAKLPLVGTFQA